MVLLTIIEITETHRRTEIQGDGTMKKTGTTEVDVILEAVTTIVVMTETVTTNGGTMILAGRMILMVCGEMMTETGVITDEMIIVGEAKVMPEDHGRIITASLMSPSQWIDRRQLLINLVRFNRSYFYNLILPLVSFFQVNKRNFGSSEADEVSGFFVLSHLWMRGYFRLG